MALTADQQAALRAELADDPKARGYAQYLPAAPGMIIQLLNEQVDSMVKTIRSTTAQAWAATGPMSSIVDTGADKTHACRASCLLVQSTLASGTDIHMELPDVQGMFSLWMAHDVITKAQHDDLYARATQPASRAEVLALGDVTVYDLVDAGVLQ